MLLRQNRFRAEHHLYVGGPVGQPHSISALLEKVMALSAE
jgi:hypothetical protein